MKATIYRRSKTIEITPVTKVKKTFFGDYIFIAKDSKGKFLLFECENKKYEIPQYAECWEDYPEGENCEELEYIRECGYDVDEYRNIIKI